MKRMVRGQQQQKKNKTETRQEFGKLRKIVVKLLRAPEKRVLPPALLLAPPGATHAPGRRSASPASWGHFWTARGCGAT